MVSSSAVIGAPVFTVCFLPQLNLSRCRPCPSSPLVPFSLACTVLQRNFCSQGGALSHDITVHFFRVIPFPSAPAWAVSLCLVVL